MNRDLLVEEVNSILKTLKNKKMMNGEYEDLSIRQLTEEEITALDIEISSSIYELVIEFLADTSYDFPVGTILEVCRNEDDEVFNLLVAEDDEGETMWLNLDFTTYSNHDSDFYLYHEVLNFIKPDVLFKKIEEVIEEI